jgi:hypothetical protein
MRRFWRSWTSGPFLVVLVMLLQEIDHFSGTFLFCNSYFFWLCASVLSLGHYVVADKSGNGWVSEPNPN